MFREPWIWFKLLVIPVAGLVAIVVFTLVAIVPRDAEESTATYALAVDSQARAPTGLIEHLAEFNFEIEVVANGATAVAREEVPVALSFEDGNARVLHLGGETASLIAADAVRHEIGRWSRAQRDDDAVRLDTTITSLDDDEALGRFSVASLLPGVLVFAMAGIARRVAERIGPEHGRQVLEPLLVQPLPRRAVVLGMGAAGAVRALVTAALLGVPIGGLLLLSTGIRDGHFIWPGAAIAATVTAAFALVVTFLAAGLVLGVMAPTPSFAENFGMAIFGTATVTALMLVMLDPGFPGWLVALPVLGPGILVRQGISGELASTDLLVVILVASLIGAAGAAVVRRQFASERHLMAWRS